MSFCLLDEKQISSKVMNHIDGFYLMNWSFLDQIFCELRKISSRSQVKIHLIFCKVLQYLNLLGTQKYLEGVQIFNCLIEQKIPYDEKLE